MVATRPNDKAALGLHGGVARSALPCRQPGDLEHGSTQVLRQPYLVCAQADPAVARRGYRAHLVLLPHTKDEAACKPRHVLAGVLKLRGGGAPTAWLAQGHRALAPPAGLSQVSHAARLLSQGGKALCSHLPLTTRLAGSNPSGGEPASGVLFYFPVQCRMVT